MTGYTDSGDEQPAARIPDQGPPTTQERKAWAAACDKLVQGNWVRQGATVYRFSDQRRYTIADCNAPGYAAFDDAAFIAIAREAVPRLLAALTTAEGERDAALNTARQQSTIIAGLQGEAAAARKEAAEWRAECTRLRAAHTTLRALYHEIADPPDPDAALVAMPALPDADGPT